MTELSNVLKYIRHEADTDDLRRIADEIRAAYRSQSRTKAHEMLKELNVQDKVRVTDGIKPKYLTNMVGRVLKIEITTAQIDFGRSFGKFRTGRVNIPLSCLQKVE